jgi:hypothetical protein
LLVEPVGAHSYGAEVSNDSKYQRLNAQHHKHYHEHQHVASTARGRDLRQGVAHSSHDRQHVPNPFREHPAFNQRKYASKENGYCQANNRQCQTREHSDAEDRERSCAGTILLLQRTASTNIC